MLQLNHLSRIKAFGNSIRPILLDQDIIYLKKSRFSRIKINDIVTVKKAGSVFTHRVIYKTPEYLITKGDDNAISDGKVLLKNIGSRLL